MTTKSASWLTKYVYDPLAQAVPFLPGGATEAAAAAARQAATQTAEAASAKQMGSDILKYTLAGAGLGLGGTRLYHMISSMNKPKPKYTKFGPGSKGVDDDEKIAEALVDQIVSAPGKLINNAFSNPANREAARVVATMGGTGLGMYGGIKLMNALMARKKKEELDEQVEDAKKEYQRALMGKSAAVLDEAFNKFTDVTKTASENPLISAVQNSLSAPFAVANKAIASAPGPSAADAAWSALTLPFSAMQKYQPAWNAYVAATLGLGALSGKMTYDWTRERSRDKALDRAQKARARMTGAPPIYVDPEQLAAIKKIAD
jgi:hypothetical protein